MIFFQTWVWSSITDAIFINILYHSTPSTALRGMVFIAIRARVRVHKRTKFECAFRFPPPESGSFGFWSLNEVFVLYLLLLWYWILSLSFIWMSSRTQNLSHHQKTGSNFPTSVYHMMSSSAVSMESNDTFFQIWVWP